MKHLIFFLASVLLISCFDMDESAPPPKAKGVNDSISKKAMADSASYTSIQWLDSANQNLGKVAKGGVVEVTWRFRNTGSKPLVIANVHASCGCTLAESPDAPIAAGKEGVIRAKYDTKGQGTGANSKTVTVMANTTGSAMHELSFHVELTEN